MKVLRKEYSYTVRCGKHPYALLLVFSHIKSIPVVKPAGM
jgi:hypothetical protein